MDPTVVYADYIAAAFAQSDFARLEMEAQRDRSEQSRLIGGVWKLNDFYDGVAKPEATNGDIDAAYQAQFASIKKWIAAYPDSATARIALAVVYLKLCLGCTRHRVRQYRFWLGLGAPRPAHPDGFERSPRSH